MEKFSVRKPYTVLVSVIVVIILGFVSLAQLRTDLLPSISLPYMIVITTYPGASPERVETMVSEPMESALGTISHVKNVYSISAENYSLTELEFEDQTDMDSTLVKVQSAVQQVSLPDSCGTPNIMEISMDMVATMYTAVSREGYDRYELSTFVDEEVTPYIERQDGVASVSSLGLVEKSVQVELNEDKISVLNDKILEKTNDSLAEAKEKLDDAKQQVSDGQEQLEEQESAFGETLASGIFDNIDAEGLSSQLENGIAEVENRTTDFINSASRAGAAAQEAAQDIAGDLGAAANDLQDAYKEAQEEAQALATAAENANKDYGDVAVRAATAAFSALDDNDADVAKAKQNVTSAIESALNIYQTAIGDLTDAQMTQAAGAALDAYLTVFPEATAEEQQALTGDVLNVLAVRKEAAQEASAKAAAAAEQAESAAQSIIEGVGVIEDVGNAKSAADSILLTDDAQSRLNAAIGELESARNTLKGSTTLSSLTKGITELTTAGAKIRVIISGLESSASSVDLSSEISGVYAALDSMESLASQLPAMMDTLEDSAAALFQGQLDAAVGFSEASRKLAEAQTQLEEAMSQYEEARTTALENANADALVTASNLSQVIYAQNFSMPAGYIDDKDDNSWLLKVGDEYVSAEDIAEALLADIDGIGTIRLSDVADITVIDNADESYARVNGDDAVVLAIYKNSTAGTNEVSENCLEEMEVLEEQHEGLHITTLMNQGQYITEIVQDILSSMALGAFLAILILALFLRDVRPTIMVGISIPLSVLFTIVLMYFSGLDMNIMTLGGLALGIGMLVDNSIVVMENIIRLRERGVSSEGAAVQGARQVSGAIISSTLTTVCVFLPMIFTTGTVRELLVPMALSITYCLTASLIVALTVIPASASVIMKRTKRKKTGRGRVFDLYEKSLRWCLAHKAAPLIGAGALLAFCVVMLLRTGIVIIPEMTGDTIEMSVTTEEGMTREESHEEMDEIMAATLALPEVAEAGAMDQSGTASLVSGMNLSETTYGSYICYISLQEGAGVSEVKALVAEIEDAVKEFPGEINVTAGGMSDLSALTGSGLTVNIYGTDEERIQEICDEVMEVASKIDGFENLSDGSEEDEAALHLVIDKDKAMEKGLTVAQIYTQIAARLTTEVTSTSITEDELNMTVYVKDETDPLTRENLLEMEFEPVSMTASGDASSAFSSGDVGNSFSLGTSSDDDASSDETASGDDESSDGTDSGDDVSSDETDSEDDASSDGSDSGEEDSETVKLKEIAYLEETTSPSSINRENGKRYRTVTADTRDSYNTTLLTRTLQPTLEEINASLPDGYSVELGGETTQVSDMVTQMEKMLALALVFIYFVMVAQFQSLLAPFIILFTIPLAFTGGMIGLLVSGQQISMMALMGFLVLMGTVVNNGIVFVDYVNQLRIGGMERREALVATGRTRMRPILMTALTTILAMVQLIFGNGSGSQMSRGMATVIAGGLAYATIMTLYIIPIIYDLLYRKKPYHVELNEEEMNAMPDDAQEFIREMTGKDGTKESSVEMQGGRSGV